MTRTDNLRADDSLLQLGNALGDAVALHLALSRDEDL